MGKIKPRFNGKFPKKAGRFLNPASDDKFKRKHRFAYGLLMACGIAAILLPLVIFVAFTDYISPVPLSGWIAPGIAGSLMIGAALFNIVAAWMKQYLGHIFTIVCFLVGGALVALSCAFLYSNSLYSLFDEHMVTYYFATILLLLIIPPIDYVMFRGSLKTRVKHPIGKTAAGNEKKAKRNFWWYEEAKGGLGWIYHINKAFTVTYAATVAVHILLGWIKPVTVLVMTGSAAVYGMAAVMALYSRLKDNIQHHGSPFVLLARSANGGMDSVLFDMLFVAFPLACGYGPVVYAAGLAYIIIL